jgi:TRAP-type C4-dicarboxylate transport system permease large subunit
VLGLTFTPRCRRADLAIIMGGMTFGWFTPTEAAIAAWAMILGVFLYR